MVEGKGDWSLMNELPKYNELMLPVLKVLENGKAIHLHALQPHLTTCQNAVYPERFRILQKVKAQKLSTKQKWGQRISGVARQARGSGYFTP